jgi:hypothetical protein
MNTIRVTTAWKGSGTPADPYRPALADDHPLSSWSDKTGGAPGVGTYSVEAVVAPAVLTAIQADPNYAGKVTVLA